MTVFGCVQNSYTDWCCIANFVDIFPIEIEPHFVTMQSLYMKGAWNGTALARKKIVATSCEVPAKQPSQTVMDACLIVNIVNSTIIVNITTTTVSVTMHR